MAKPPQGAGPPPGFLLLAAMRLEQDGVKEGRRWGQEFGEARALSALRPLGFGEGTWALVVEEIRITYAISIFSSSSS